MGIQGDLTLAFKGTIQLLTGSRLSKRASRSQVPRVLKRPEAVLCTCFFGFIEEPVTLQTSLCLVLGLEGWVRHTPRNNRG